MTDPGAPGPRPTLEFCGFSDDEAVFEQVRKATWWFTCDGPDAADVARIIDVVVDALLQDPVALRPVPHTQQSDQGAIVMFHWEHGIFFGRENNDGDVLLKLGEQGLSFTIPASQWVSLVAGVTPTGDNAETYAAVEKLHRG